MNIKIKAHGCELEFSDDDVVDLDDWIPQGEYNPHNIHPFLFHDHGFTICVVFAANLQDALDKAVDDGRLDRYQIADADRDDYPDDEGITFLGNASEPFDIESLGWIELPNPHRSFVAQFAAENFPILMLRGERLDT